MPTGSGGEKNLLVAALGAISAVLVVSTYLAWPSAGPGARPRAGEQRLSPAPLGVERIPGNPTIEPAPLHGRPRGFPADLPTYEANEVVQAYRSYRPGEPGFHTAIVYRSGASPAAIIGRYRQWLSERQWDAALQPTEAEASAVHATNGRRRVVVSTAADEVEQTLVTVSYAEQ
jgi:hypothetical protein